MTSGTPPVTAAPSRVVVRLPNWVGDIMMALPVLRDLRRAWPRARLVGMVRPRHVALAERVTWLDAVTVAPDPSARSRTTMAVVRALRRADYDAAIVLAPSFEAALTMWLARVPLRVGQATDRRAWLLTHPVVPGRGHRTDGLRDVVQRLGVARSDSGSSGFVCTPDDRGVADGLLHDLGIDAGQRPVFVNPASAKAPRAWSSDRFRRLAEHLSRSYPDTPVLVHDHDPFEYPPGWGGAGAIRRVSGVSLVELAAVLERCAVYVGNDSGPMHLAAALGLPTVGIYGPSSPDHTAPLDPRHVPVTERFPCAPCRERFFDDCPSPPTADRRPPCLDAIGVETVTAAVDRLIEERPRARP